MTPCDCTLKNFVLQDLFSETGTLKVCISFSYKCMHDPVCLLQPNGFVFVSRCAKSFRGEIESVFWCSCNPQRAQLVDCIPPVSSESFNSFLDNLPSCMHITAAKVLLEEIDGINGLSPTLEFAGINKESLKIMHKLIKHPQTILMTRLWMWREDGRLVLIVVLRFSLCCRPLVM